MPTSEAVRLREVASGSELPFAARCTNVFSTDVAAGVNAAASALANRASLRMRRQDAARYFVSQVSLIAPPSLRTHVPLRAEVV